MTKSNFAGPIKALVVDLAGTVIDYGSCAPSGAFVELFRREGIALSDAQARGPMGMNKREHIRQLTLLPEVAAQWEDRYGHPCQDPDIDRLYEQFIPLQVSLLPEFCTKIPGAFELIDRLQKQGLKVAGNTGYNRQMMDIVLAKAKDQGFVPDAAKCSDDVPAGRPAPWLILQCLQAMNVYPPALAIVVGDTIPDIEAGLNAGAWSVGVIRTGNMLGLNEADAFNLPADELRSRLLLARDKMERAGAHFVVDSIADCDPVIEQINRRLAEGERP